MDQQPGLVQFVLPKQESHLLLCTLLRPLWFPPLIFAGRTVCLPAAFQVVKNECQLGTADTRRAAVMSWVHGGQDDF